MAGKRRQEIALLRQLLLQGRQRCLGLSEGRFLCHQVDFGYLAQRQLAPEQIHEIGLDPDDVLRRRDLSAQGCFLHRRGDDIRGQGDISGLELEPLRLR